MLRRDLFASLSALAALGAWRRQAQESAEPQTDASEDSLVADLEVAERVIGIRFTDAEREQAVGAVRDMQQRFAARPSFEPGQDEVPALRFDPYFGNKPPVDKRAPAPAAVKAELPADRDDLGFASLARLRGHLDAKEISSVELTQLFLDRCERLDPKLMAIVTRLDESALAEAARCDRELAAGESRGFLHGIPYGAKDLFDTKGIRTTYGAAPFRDRVPDRDARVVQQLREAGAVLIAKTSLGALAYGDLWFGGRTRCPWNTELGSSGSSAGSASGVAGGLFPFALGTETYGSIVSPSVRNGATGLRPTFDSVSREGAMALCWSLDKVGPLARRAEDALAVFGALAPARADDTKLSDMRVGYRPAWFEGQGGDPRALEALRAAGVKLVEIELPEGPFDALLTVLFTEAAAAFESLTRSDADDRLTWQADQAWPNSFRAAWFTPAIELVQADRLRTRLALAYRELFAGVDAMVGPPFADDLVLTTNFTGHPCLVLRSSIRDGVPQSMCLWGRLGGEATLGRLGGVLEEAFDCWDERPPGF